MMFELGQLRCFVAVVEELHFGRAAERLHMTQPPLSRQIQILEQRVGTQLLNRSNRTVGLTPAGRAFFPEAVSILQRADAAALLARRIAAGGSGSLNIGFTAAAGYSVLPDVLRRIRLRFPDTVISLKELVSTVQLDALNAGEIDIGLNRAIHQHSNLACIPIRSEALLLAIPEREAYRWPDDPTLACLDGQRIIMYSPYDAGPFYQLLMRRFEEEGVVPDIVESVGQMHTMLALVSAGIGAALVSESCLRLQFEGVTYRRLSSEMVSTVCAYRRDNENPVLRLFARDILPSFQTVLE